MPEDQSRLWGALGYGIFHVTPVGSVDVLDDSLVMRTWILPKRVMPRAEVALVKFRRSPVCEAEFHLRSGEHALFVSLRRRPLQEALEHHGWTWTT